MCTFLESSSWSIKKQAGQSIQFLCDKFGVEIVPHCDTLLKVILASLSGRTWKGKECILMALGAVCNRCSATIQKSPESVKSVISVMTRECKKNDKEYKRHAVQTLAEILKAFRDIDIFEDVKDLLYTLAAGEEGNQQNQDEDAKDKPISFLIK
jgi:proteasome component ECM29